MDLDDVADELYALPPDGFTAARKAKVDEARRSGDRRLATAIGELRRPTATASIVNLLARSRPDLIDDLLALGEDLRQAQTSLAGEDLRRLSARRIEVVSDLVDEGRRLAAQQQRPASPQVESELSATLQAALADPEAAAAVRSGRLVGALHYSGFGLGAGTGETPTTQPRTARPARPAAAAPAAEAPPDAGEVRGDAVAAATETLDVARARLDEVESAASTAEAAVDTARERRQAAAERITDLEQQLSQAREDEREAARQVRTAEKDQDRAARTVEGARRRAEQAQQALNRRRSQ